MASRHLVPDYRSVVIASNELADLGVIAFRTPCEHRPLAVGGSPASTPVVSPHLSIRYLVTYLARQDVLVDHSAGPGPSAFAVVVADAFVEASHHPAALSWLQGTDWVRRCHRNYVACVYVQVVYYRSCSQNCQTRTHMSFCHPRYNSM